MTESELGFFVSYPGATVYEVVSTAPLTAGLVLVRQIDPKPGAEKWAVGGLVLDLRKTEGAFFKLNVSANAAAVELRRNLKAAKRAAGRRPR